MSRGSPQGGNGKFFSIDAQVLILHFVGWTNTPTIFFIREQKEKQDAKDRYWKLHMQGKTEEAKNDLNRLAQIRADREAAQAKRKAEAEGELFLFLLKRIQ